mgnify:CR=1 FL=1
MDRILIFAGTTEGRRLAEFLNENGVFAHVCVATEYGEQLLPKGENIRVHAGRLAVEEMEELIAREQITLIVDATHPYAVLVSENIRTACEHQGVFYVRLERRVSQKAEEAKKLSDVITVESVAEAAEFLSGVEGNVFAATGSKELAAYTVIPDYKNRVFARVLSTAEVAVQCQKLGFTGKNLICMQGPFSEALNTAMLKQVNAAWMVTKEAGKAGGFEEKLRAARNAGARLVIVKRPDSVKKAGGSGPKAEDSGQKDTVDRQTMSENKNVFSGDEFQVREVLCRKCNIHPHRQVSLVGIGMGSAENQTLEAVKVCEEAELLIGAGRMLACVDTNSKAVFQAYKADEIAEYIAEHPQYEKVAVILSGDIGFYSGAKKLYDAIRLADKEKKLTIVPVSGISSVVYFCGKLGKAWEDVQLVSLHGRRQNLISAVKHHKKVFALCGEAGGIQAVCRKLMEYGLGDVKMYVGTDLSYETERITAGTPAEFVKQEFAKLSVFLIENEDVDTRVTHGIEDESFLRAKVPMTKSEVRSISLSKLCLTKDAVVWDVGAGTGSVSIEAALQAAEGEVYAVEKKPEAVELLLQNKIKFAADNLTVVEGLAPEALTELPAPTHAFIGGSSGNLKEIMEVLLEKNPQVRIVINAIALETVSEAVECLKTLPVCQVDIVSVSVGKAKQAGAYHMMIGQNPVYILSCTGGDKA